MGYDVAIVVCVLFIVACVFAGIYTAYCLVFEATDVWFGDHPVVKTIFRVVLFPLAVCVVFFFLSYPILFVFGMAVQLSFHGA